MTHLILATHGTLAESYKQTIAMIAGHSTAIASDCFIAAIVKTYVPSVMKSSIESGNSAGSVTLAMNRTISGTVIAAESIRKTW